MVFSDKTIKQMMEQGVLVIRPLGENALQAASVDLRLGSDFLVVEQNALDSIRLDQAIPYREIKAESITVPPHTFILATTCEYVEIPNFATAAVEGRSSIGRLGLFIQNAGWIDPGFKGNITLELFNANSLPIRLEAGRRICQLVLYKMDQEVGQPYQGKYLNQIGTTGSRVFQDKELSPKQK